MQLLTASSSFFPKHCEVMIPPPLPIPLHIAKKRNVTEPVAPIAARASAFTYLPTITESTRLYTCWKRLPMSMGTEKRSISDTGLPSVINKMPDLCFLSSMFFYLLHD